LKFVVDKLNTLVRLLINAPRYKRRLKQLIIPLLERESISIIGEEFTASDLRKIEEYYGINVPLVLGNMMGSLHGRALTIREIETLMLMGTISGLYDDFFDKHKLPLPTIKELTTTYTISSSAPANVKAYQIFLKELVARLPDIDSFEKSFLKVFDAQVESLQQREPLSPKRLLEIADNKGGRSLQFYRTAFSGLPTEVEQHFWFSHGYIGTVV